jgi:hypothetical protein
MVQLRNLHYSLSENAAVTLTHTSLFLISNDAAKPNKNAASLKHSCLK